jgi:hypothetical protein
MEYVCRGIVRSEDAICRLNKRVSKLAKCVHNTNTGVICIGVCTILLCSVVWMQDNEIKALQKQVANLAKDEEAVESDVNDAANDMEEQNQQEGA